MRSCFAWKHQSDLRVASAEDAKNCEESDMAILAGWYEARSVDSRRPCLAHDLDAHAVNLVLQILETR